MGPDLDLTARAVSYIGVVIRKSTIPFQRNSGPGKGLAEPDEWISNDRVPAKHSGKSCFLGFPESLSMCQLNH